MDADLQDPPEIVLDMIAKWKEGYDVDLRRATPRVKAKAASNGRRPICSTA